MAHSLELEQAVLEVLYKKCLDRPLWVSESEVFWNISDVRVTEREVREVLEQLVYHRRIVKQVGKYQISKAEFLAIKEQMEGLGELQGNEQPPTECNQSHTENLVGKKGSRTPVLKISVLAILLLLLGCILGLFLAERDPQEPLAQITHQEIALSLVTPPKHTLPNLSAKDEVELKRSLKGLSAYLQSQQEAYGTMAKRIDSLQREIVELKGNTKAQEQVYEQKIERLQYIWLATLGIVLCLGTLAIIESLKFHTKKSS